VPRSLNVLRLAGALVFLTPAFGCNEIRYQASRIPKPKLEGPASLPDRRFTYDCKIGDSFDAYFPPGGAGIVLSIGGDERALRELSAEAGDSRYGDGVYELVIQKEDSFVSHDDKRIREGCRRRP